MRELELLAPAKNLECGMAAIDCGADAVYIGASRFGARQAAGNSVGDIATLCTYAHQFGCKVYVTVNTIVYDRELDDTRKFIDELASAGADAILVQDMALLRMQLPQNLPLHASTQTDNRSAEKVEWLSTLGFTRVVLARELTLSEIAHIHKANPTTELEVFVHGALCVCYSGVCYASEHCFARSANRGACAQFCRMKFDLLDAEGNTLGKDAHLLSLKDLCRIDSLESLADAGVTSFKIEGRLKDINYVRNVTAAYSKRLDEIIERRSNDYRRASRGTCRPAFTPDLRKTFNRGFTEYFLDGRKSSLASFYTPKAMGEYVGKVKEISGNSFTVAGTAAFANGDGLCFINASHELEGFRINKATGNRLYPLRLPQGLRRGTALYRNADKQFERELEEGQTTRKLPVSISLRADDGTLTLSAQAVGTTARASATMSTALEEARSPQTENICRQLSKLGNTILTAGEITVSPSPFNLFIPNSVLTALRRQCIESLEEELRKPIAPTPASPQREAALSAPMPPQRYPMGYMYNIANRLAAEFYDDCSLNNLQPAYEIAKPSGAMLMQCRYCLRYEMGICKKTGNRGAAIKEPLKLRLGDGRTFRLEFDCKNCEMHVYAEK